MPESSSPRVVIDTNVIFEGLTQRGRAAGLVIDAWLAGLLSVYVSSALAYQYVAVLSRKLSEVRWQHIRPVLGHLLAQAEFVTVYYTWRPTSPDPADEKVIDCAMNAGAAVITANVRDFDLARRTLGLHVMTPAELIARLTE